ncbi:MAG: nucleotidyltransferase domain-containing protein [Bacillota bacterium]|nr:nucleotidyltransferase domain-containing protein [Bacillota bacterium]
MNLNIKYPSSNYRDYIERVYKFCKDNGVSMILKGSLAKGIATKYSDIDLIILSRIEASKIDELINIYGKPVMTNFTENPKGILILVYEDNISVDLDLRETISEEDLMNSVVILKSETSFNIDNKIVRNQISSNYMPNRPEWYKVLRLLHRGMIKYLSNKPDIAYELLSEIKDSLISLKITDLSFNNDFENDIQCIFNRFCKDFEVDSRIKGLFNNLFKEFNK